MPKVSFVLPAYKYCFLREAIASILAQTYRDFELIVVDDCSPEDLKSVVDGFCDERLSYYRNDCNIGGKDLVAAWNGAMKYARGEWCVLASDDDVYLPRFLEELMLLQAKYPTCDLFHARNVTTNAAGAWGDVQLPRREFESQIEFTYARAVARAEQRAADFMFRLSAFTAMGGFVRFPLAWYTDDATWMVLARNGCAHTAEIMFAYRDSGINLSSLADASALVKLDATDQYVKWFDEFAKHLTPKSDTEDFLLGRLVAGNRKNAKGMKNWIVDNICHFGLWWRVLRSGSYSPAEFRGHIYVRYPWITAIRRLLP